MVKIFLFLLLTYFVCGTKQDDIVLLPLAPEGKLQYQIDQQKITSSHLMVGNICMKRNFPRGIKINENIEEIGIVQKRVNPAIRQLNLVKELMVSTDVNSYMVVGSEKNEEILSEILYNLTQFKIDRFGKVNTKIYNPIDNVFYGINESELEKPNGWFYSSNKKNNDFVNEFSFGNIFSLNEKEEDDDKHEQNEIEQLKRHLKKNMKELKKEWKLNQISNQQMYMKLTINLKENEYEYCEIDILQTNELQIQYPSKEDEYARNLYFLNTCGTDYHSREYTCKVTRFAERGKESEMIDFGTLQYEHDLPLYLQTLKGEGSHQTVSVTMFGYKFNEEGFYSVYTVPQGMFIDKYQLQEITRKRKDIEVFMYEPMDLEAPYIFGRQAHVIVKYIKPMKDSIAFTLPIHLRYHKASESSLFETNVIFPAPETFYVCENCTKTKSIESLKHTTIGYTNVPITCSITDPKQFITADCDVQIPSYTIPVGQLTAFDFVMKITLGITLLSSIIVVLSLIIF